MLEKVVQPLCVFPDIDKYQEIPNSLYSFYQDQYGISIVRVEEELQAATLNQEQADLLEVNSQDPVLLVQRASISIDGSIVEWSEALCSTEKFVYSVSLR